MVGKLRQHKKGSQRKAFTLVELVVSVVLAGILSGVGVVAYQGVSERANQGAINATATMYERKMIHLVVGGETPQGAYEEILAGDVPADVTFEPSDGSGIVVGGETEMSVSDAEGWTAHFIAPDRNTTTSSVVGVGVTTTTTTVPLGPANTPVMVTGYYGQASKILFQFPMSWGGQGWIETRYCTLITGCEASDLTLLTDTVSNNKDRDLSDIQPDGVVYVAISSSQYGPDDLWECGMTEYVLDSPCERVGST